MAVGNTANCTACDETAVPNDNHTVCGAYFHCQFKPMANYIPVSQSGEKTEDNFLMF